MKTIRSVALGILSCLLLAPALVRAAAEEPTIYVIQKGDTLWGLSERFLNDPYYWPNLWSKNPEIGNPHVIHPGQKVKVYSDRIEVVPQEGARAAAQPKGGIEEAAAERSFLASGSEGFLIEQGNPASGSIITTNQNRVIVGEEDIVYVDIGASHGARSGDRFGIFEKGGLVSHPVSNVILGEKAIPLGWLQLTEVEALVSKAIIVKSYQEIGPGALLLPFQEKRRSIALKASDRDLVGYIVETQTGNNAIGEGDLMFLDLGRRHGVEPGNLLYVLRDVEPDQQHADVSVTRLPPEVIGALVVVTVGESTSTALTIKSIDTIYRGDRVEMRRNR